MKDPNWLKRELSAAAKEASKLPEWKRWGAEIETQDTAIPSKKATPKPPEDR